MRPSITFKRDMKSIKKPLHLKNRVFVIYAPKKLTFSPMRFDRYNKEITVSLPKDSRGYFTSKYKTDEIEQVSSNPQRIRIGVINKSLVDNIVIKKGKVFGLFVLELKGKINIKHETEAKIKTLSKISKKKIQPEVFLNRYDFAYAGIDTVYQLGKVAPGVIKSVSSEIDKIAQQRINQIIRQAGQEIERILPKILCGAIEDVYQTPFRMLGNFGKQQLQKLKRKILK